MTKRFKFEWAGAGVVTIIDTTTNEKILASDIVYLLNSLNDENEQLKKELVHKKLLLDSLQDKYSGLLKLVHGFGDVRMKEKYCPLPISTCEFGTDRKADCENCDLNKRYYKRTVDNWESYIVDGKTGKEYGADINPLINLLNELYEENKQLKQEGANVEKLIDDLGSEELRRQYEEIINGDVE